MINNNIAIFAIMKLNCVNDSSIPVLVSSTLKQVVTGGDILKLIVNTPGLKKL